MKAVLGVAIGIGLASYAGGRGVLGGGRVPEGGGVWAWLPPVLASLGVASLLSGPPPWSPEVDASTAMAVGAALGLALYIATRIFFVIGGRGDLPRRFSIVLFKRQGGVPLGVGLLLSSGRRGA